jgi:ABC-type antimicrobial peptide transport system permease subunit
VLIPAIGTVPLMGQLFEDTSGKGDIQMNLSFATIGISALVLMLIGVASGFFPALKASRMNPVEALRYE